MEEKNTQIPEHLKEIVSKIEEMKVKDLALLVKILEEKLGVSSQMMVSAQAVPQAQAKEGEAFQEKSEFSVLLKKPGASKIQVIKLIKEITGKGLKESKDLVDASEKSPQLIKEKVSKEEAENIQKKLTEAGAEVEIK
jgi:large subunit ribosomal protein L7/L12